MKRTILSTLCLAALTCAAQSNAPTLASSYNDFAFDFFQRIESEHVDENIILSPLSAQFALSMLQNGAGGNTLTEIQQALHTAGYTLDDVNRYNRALIDQLQKEPQISDWEREAYAAIGLDPRDNFARVEIANGIWVCNELPVYPSFFETNANYYDASAEAVDFGAPETYARLDQWAYDHTHGLIPSFGLEPSTDRAMVLANTLYFEGPWSSYFYDDYTRKRPFTNADGSTVDVDMMWCLSSGELYAQTDNFEMQRRYYGADKRFCMNLYLPKHDDAVLTVDEWRTLNATTQVCDVDIHMPRFSIEDNLDLIDILEGMGIHDAFSPKNANFSPISPMALFLSKVYQKARIEVDEAGTAAAALTVIDIDCTGMPDPDKVPPLVTLNFDRPFYFTIEDCADHSILFMGHITDLAELERRAGQQEGIDTVLAPSPASHRTYDLQGRPVADGQRGISIRDRRKTIR